MRLGLGAGPATADVSSWLCLLLAAPHAGTSGCFVYRLPLGMQIFCKTLTGHTVTLDVVASLPAEDVDLRHVITSSPKVKVDTLQIVTDNRWLEGKVKMTDPASASYVASNHRGVIPVHHSIAQSPDSAIEDVVPRVTLTGS